MSISGEVDLVVDSRVDRAGQNGVPLLARITRIGLHGHGHHRRLRRGEPIPFQAATHAMAMMGIAGEMAAEHAGGPGTFQALLLDALGGVTHDELERRAGIEGV